MQPNTADSTARSPRVRDPRIDALRGLSIALIVVQHLGWAYLAYEAAPGLAPTFVGTWSDLSRLGPVWFNLLRYSSPFCVTVFAFVAGYLALASLARPFRTFFASRATGLMLPFLAWTVVYAFFPPAMDRFFVTKSGGAAFVWESVLHPTGGVAGPLWFLEVLFISLVLAWVVDRLPFSRVLLPLSALLALEIPRALGILGISGTFGIAELGAIYPYVVGGILIARRGSLWPRGKVLDLLGVAAAYLLAYSAQPYLATATVGVARGLPSVLASVARDDVWPLVVSGLGIWLCVQAIALLRPGAVGPLAYVGRYSLGIMGSHLLVIATLVALGAQTPWIVFPVTLSASLGVSWLLDRNRVTRLVFLGGRGAGQRQAASG